MKKLAAPIFIILLFAGLWGYVFSRKHYLSLTLVASVPHRCGEFNPLNYEFFHSRERYERYMQITKETRQLQAVLPSADSLDFDRYSYCITYGKPVQAAYYSYKANWFDDPSPSYASARRSGKKYVVVHYEQVQDSTGTVFLYRVEKNDKLRSADGL